MICQLLSILLVGSLPIPCTNAYRKMATSSIVKIFSAVVFCILIVVSAAQSEEQSRDSWVDDEEAPYHVSIWFYNSFVCSGTLISFRDILTVAHPVVGLPRDDYAFVTVRTGSNRLRTGGKVHHVQRITIHPNYTFSLDGFHSNDIALIRLTKYIDMTTNQQGIMLGREDLANGTQAVVTGWARNLDSSRLMKVSSTIISEEVCQEMVNNALRPNQFCTFDAAEPSVCVGNPGSPLVTDHKLYGVLVQPAHCGSGFSEIYVKVAPYRVFIAQAMF